MAYKFLFTGVFGQGRGRESGAEEAKMLTRYVTPAVNNE